MTTPPPLIAAFNPVPPNLFGLEVKHREDLGLSDDQVKILTDECTRYQETLDVNTRQMARGVARVNFSMYGETLPTTEQMEEIDRQLVQWAAAALELVRAHVAGAYHGMKALTPEQIRQRAVLHLGGEIPAAH